jgi:lipid-binding SYLF domain-containing protein
MTRAAGLAIVLSSVIATNAFAALSTGEQKRLNDAAGVVTALRTAENGISEDLWQKAACVIVIPDMKKVALGIGGEYGKGVMSCRAANGWSSPVFMELEKGSWGFQAGATEIDLVLLVMNRDAATRMLNSKVSLGADASVAAGPVGRAASASTNGSLDAQVLSYSRSKGLFAGVNLSGGALKVDKDSNTDAYGTTTAVDVMNGGGTKLTGATAFLNTLGTGARATTGTRTPATTDAPKY